MTAEITKMIVVTVDGSETALKSLDYVNLIYGPKHHLELTLLYILPSLPPILVTDQDRETKLKLLAVEKKNVRLAERILGEAKEVLLKKGFAQERIHALHRKKQVGIARDICTFAEDKRADAVLITTKGRSRLEAFFTGEISSRLLEFCRVCPVWITEGTVRSKWVLVAIDSSENALRAVDHTGFMLAGTDCQVTLFHSKRHLRRFLPQEVIQEAPELEELWKHKAGEQIAPYVNKAKKMLLEAGLSEAQIHTKVVDGSRSPAGDILREARESGCGTIVLGRRGVSGVKEFFMGSITSKVLQDCAGMAVWVVQ